MAAPAAPALTEFHAPADWKSIDFVSDIHLAADTPRTVDAFAAYLRCTDAGAVFILGDLFEVWVGDDSRHEGFEAHCTALLREAAVLRPLAFMAGNRDFLVGDDFLADCGVTALADPTVLVAFGERRLLSHGDALCLGDLPYMRFRAEVRTPHWREAFLARPLAQRRQLARDIRTESERRKTEQPMASANRIDIDTAAAVGWMRACDAPTLIHGHTHLPGDETMAPGSIRHVLSDWDLDQVHHREARAEVLRLTASGLRRLSPADLCSL